MAEYLISSTDVYRVESEAEAMAMIEKAKHDKHFILTKYTSELKETKDDSFYKVTLVKSFTNIKAPDVQTFIKYSTSFSEDVEESEDD